MKLKAGYIGLYVAVLSISILLTSFNYQQTLVKYNSRELLSGIMESIAKIKTLRYDLKCNERIHGKMVLSESKVKLQISPRKLYISFKGPEVLWIQGTNNGNALVNPAAFPYMDLNLDPYGSLMRKDQHHTIHEMGFQYLTDILKEGIKLAGDNLSKYAVILGEEKFNERNCYKLSIVYPDFAWVQYTVKEKEDITSIARKFHLNEYMILEKNPAVSWFDDVKPGQIIYIPNAYAKLTMLLIDKELLLPLSEKVFDDKGLFETYEYINLMVNPQIASEEFTKEYKGYNF